MDDDLLDNPHVRFFGAVGFISQMPGGLLGQEAAPPVHTGGKVHRRTVGQIVECNIRQQFQVPAASLIGFGDLGLAQVQQQGRVMLKDGLVQNLFDYIVQGRSAGKLVRDGVGRQVAAVGTRWG
ncbi:hypothetical protein [Pseudomonas sp. R4-35-07]|uniref:hypothetical protein n=1 Tax=Pseudomonas sp. R4-35-07 TaxID=658643 RepID=UPI000F57BBF6|nr:hypothetical protein [Pseudomonas sp. R4-35-07]